MPPRALLDKILDFIKINAVHSIKERELIFSR